MGPEAGRDMICLLDPRPRLSDLLRYWTSRLRSRGVHISIETPYQVLRVHPAVGWESIFIDPRGGPPHSIPIGQTIINPLDPLKQAFRTRLTQPIEGSDKILAFRFTEIAGKPRFLRLV